jgi:hypothetical protein
MMEGFPINKVLSSLTGSLFLCLVDLLLFFFVFLLIEYFYLDAEFLTGARNASISLFVRVIFLQIFFEYVAVAVCFYFTRNIYVLFVVMIGVFFSYYSYLRGELVPLEQLFGFGSYGKTTPSFLVFLVSSIFTAAAFRYQSEATRKDGAAVSRRGQSRDL